MKLASVQFIHVVGFFGQQIHGASDKSVGDRPGQPAFEIEIVQADLPCVKLSKKDVSTGKLRTCYVPLTNVASFVVKDEPSQVQGQKK